jgi:hypothetical protein
MTQPVDKSPGALIGNPAGVTKMTSNLAVQAGSRFGNYQRRASGDVLDERLIESKTLVLENPLFDEDSL